MEAYPKRGVREKVHAILTTLKPTATGAQVRALTDDQWAELGRRAGVGDPSPIVREVVKDRVGQWDVDRATAADVVADERADAEFLEGA